VIASLQAALTSYCMVWAVEIDDILYFGGLRRAVCLRVVLGRPLLPEWRSSPYYPAHVRCMCRWKWAVGVVSADKIMSVGVSSWATFPSAADCTLSS
jgi:hypothetical protein